jgi:hypothetical protein
MKEKIVDVNYDRIHEVLKVSQDRWSGIKFGVDLVYRYIDDVTMLIFLAGLKVEDYEGAEIIFHPCRNLYSKSGQYCSCFRATIEKGEFYLTDIYLDSLSLTASSLSVVMEEPDFFTQEPDLLSDEDGNMIRVSYVGILSFAIGKIGIGFDYKVKEYDDLIKFIRSIFKEKREDELRVIENNVSNYFRRNFLNRIRKIKLEKYLGGVA